MMMRSSRTEPPDLTTCVTKTTDDMIESLVCPPPPSDSALNEEAISSLIVPAPKWNKENVSPDGESTAPPSDRSDRSSGHMTSDRGSGIIQSERGSGHIHSSERDSGIGGITIGPISRNRGSNGHTGDMIIGKDTVIQTYWHLSISSFQAINQRWMWTPFFGSNKHAKLQTGRSAGLRLRTENPAPPAATGALSHSN